MFAPEGPSWVGMGGSPCLRDTNLSARPEGAGVWTREDVGPVGAWKPRGRCIPWARAHGYPSRALRAVRFGARVHPAGPSLVGMGGSHVYWHRAV